MPLLQHRRVFQSRDPEETRAFMQTKEFDLDLETREAGAFDFVANAAYLPNSYIGYVCYGSAVRVHVPAERKRDDFFIHFPVRGKSEIVNHAGSVVCARGRGVISSPAGYLTRSEGGSARITLSLTKCAMMGQLAALLGDAPMRPLEFSAAIDLTSAVGRRLSRHMGLAIADLDEPDSARNPIVLGMYEQLIMTGLLLNQPSNYSGALHGRQTNVAPRDVQRAIDYMQSHLDLPLTLSDIVAASGIPGRTLLKHFRDHHGVSPMRYLRNARLARVREALRHAVGRESVTQIALSLGFEHLGRFAVEYRRHFGESPSETRIRQPARVGRSLQAGCVAGNSSQRTDSDC